jgi:tetratricopeptide (TPR) repeat protein
VRLRALSLAAAALISASAAPAAAAPAIELTAPGYRVISEVGERPTREFLGEIAGFRRVLEALLGVKARSTRVETMVFIAAHETWERSLQPGAGIAGFWAPGRFENFIAVTSEVPRSQALPLIFHELAHDFVQTNLEHDVPAWWSEGFAELAANTRVQGGSLRLDVPAAHLPTLGSSAWLPMEYVLTVDRSALGHGEDSSSFYAQAWLLLHYGRAEDPAFGARLDELVAAFDRGAAVRKSAEAILGMSYAELDALLRKYAKRFRSRKLQVAAAAAEPLAFSAPRGISWRELQLSVAQLARDSGQAERALPLYDALLADASDAHVLSLRAYASALASRPDAEEWIARAREAATEPDLGTALALALSLLNRADAATPPGEPIAAETARLAEASRALFELAHQRAPGDLTAIYGFALTSYYCGDQLELAAERLARVRELHPASAELAYAAALVAERQEHFGSARAAWRIVAKHARFAQLRNRARDRLLALASSP